MGRITGCSRAKAWSPPYLTMSAVYINPAQRFLTPLLRGSPSPLRSVWPARPSMLESILSLLRVHPRRLPVRLCPIPASRQFAGHSDVYCDAALASVRRSDRQTIRPPPTKKANERRNERTNEGTNEATTQSERRNGFEHSIDRSVHPPQQTTYSHSAIYIHTQNNPLTHPLTTALQRYL